MKLYWTHQHGAIISLGVSCLIGILLSSRLELQHLGVAIFCLGLFHAAELMFEWHRKEAGLIDFKSISLKIYLALTVASAVALLYESAAFRAMALPLGTLGLAVGWKHYSGEKKTVYTELLSFATLSALGLLALNPFRPPDKAWFILWVVLTSYFGLSVFLVKARVEKITERQGLLYLAGIMLLYFIVLPAHAAVILSVLVAGRSVPFLIVPAWGGTWRLRTIGLVETGFAVLLILIFVMALDGSVT